MNKILIKKDLLEETLRSLRESDTREKMVLWFGIRTEGDTKIEKVFVPIQESTALSLTIDEAGVGDVIREVKDTGYVVLAQMHTHPRGAFHSYADDTLAILSHEGAISMVLPSFAQSTTIENFFNQVAAFSLTNGRWKSIPKKLFEKQLLLWD